VRKEGTRRLLLAGVVLLAGGFLAVWPAWAESLIITSLAGPDESLGAVDGTGSATAFTLAGGRESLFARLKTLDARSHAYKLAEDKLGNKAISNETVAVPVKVLFSGILYQANRPLEYSNIIGRTGEAKW
jgi:hypothetical protein